MSYDFDLKLENCDHMQTAERYAINPNDFKTLQWVGLNNKNFNMRAPINNPKNVEIYVGGVLISSKDPLFGYTIMKDINILGSSDQFYKIVFNNPLRIVKPLIEVSYITTATFCLKCLSTGTLNDYKNSNSGSFTHIVSRDKLIQKSLKWVLTSRCPFYPSFICRIKDFIGQKYGITITDVDISQEVLSALQKMKKVQQTQGTVQTLDSGEILRDITSVNAQLDPNNPTLVSVSINITGSKNNSTPINFTLRANN
jgi:hypothetical protein